MSNNKLKQNNYKKNNFFKCTAGNVIISFAIMLPAMFTCMLVSIDHTETMRNRARLSEAANEASLAVIAINNKNIDGTALEQNQQIALNYINYFVNQKISSDKLDGANIKIEYKADKKEYDIAYKQMFNSLITHNDYTSNKESEAISVSNKKESYGNTQKYDVGDTVAIAFISDFSGSATCEYSNTQCNDYTSVVRNSDTRRLNYMRKAIGDAISRFEDYPIYNFALVPYDIGVPVLTNVNNPADGEGYSCSVMYKMQAPYDSIDYNFWANKNIAYPKWSKLKKVNLIDDYLTYNYFNRFNKNTAYYYLDYYYYLYYSKIIGPAVGAYSDSDLVDKNLCEYRHNIEQVNMGSSRYACNKKTPDDYPLSLRNRRKVERQYAKIVQLYDYMFSGDYDDVHGSFANTKTVDVDGTIESLFTKMNQNIITFNRIISPTMTSFSPFQGMCQSPLYSNGVMSKEMINMSDSERFAEAANHVRNFKALPHLVPLSDDNEDHKAHNRELREFISDNNVTWQPGGGTDTMTALLRTVPVMAKESSNNKIMIIITDGKDDKGADKLRDDFLDSNVCQSITEGLTSKENYNRGYIKKPANVAAIYYIKLDPNASNLTTDAEYEAMYGKWFTKCMKNNKNYLFEAQDYQSLFDAINRIIEVETGNFINKSE
jgi:tight adherence protein G